VIVPESPERFFSEFLPAAVSELGAAPASNPQPPAAAAPPAPIARRRGAPSSAGVVVRVVGVGEWTLRLAERALSTSAGMADDAALQLSLRAEDFSALVVEPVRRALAARGDAEATQLAARALWTRLGRFDDETAQLLRQQQGNILVRIDDAGTARNVALTPGRSAYSLERGECTIDCALSALLELQEKRKSPLDLFYEGRIRIGGDAQVALAIAGLFL
jgi:SCP-2 sterol transfer family protein